MIAFGLFLAMAIACMASALVGFFLGRSDGRRIVKKAWQDTDALIQQTRAELQQELLRTVNRKKSLQHPCHDDRCPGWAKHPCHNLDCIDPAKPSTGPVAGRKNECPLCHAPAGVPCWEERHRGRTRSRGNQEA